MNTELFLENRRVYQREYMKARRAGENGLEVRAKEKEYNKIYKQGVGNEDYTWFGLMRIQKRIKNTKIVVSSQPHM